MSAFNSSKTPKPVLRDRLREAIAGVTAHYGKTSSLVLNGVSITPSDLIMVLQAHIDALDAADALGRQWHTAVVVVKTKSVTTKSVLPALADLVASQFGKGSAVLGDFGFTPRKVGKVGAVTKGQAVTKAAATRLSNGTVGKKQRKARAKAPKPTTPASTSSNGSHPQG